MNGSAIEMTGQRFGRLVVLARAPNGTAPTARWFCACDCGKQCLAVGAALRRGDKRSCGCLASEESSRRASVLSARHGHAADGRRSRAYTIYSSMLSRCRNPNHVHFQHYGGRGIAVCDRWTGDFAAFLADMGEPPAGMTLERIDNDDGYGPSNCRWATREEQGANSRKCRMISHAGRTMHLSAWARELGISPEALYQRLKKGWPTDRALTETKRPA